MSKLAKAVLSPRYVINQLADNRVKCAFPVLRERYKRDFDVLMENLLRITAYRPWPVPKGVWIMKQTWDDLLFAHWPVNPDMVRRYISPGLHVDTFDGQAWLGIVPFQVSGLRLRAAPPVPGISRFAEVNVRTYVTRGGKPGVWFFSLDATNALAVWGARWAFHLPYFRAHIRCNNEHGWTHYSVARTTATLETRYRGVGDVFHAIPGTFEHFACERYCLYTSDKKSRLIRCEIHHAPWPLQRGEAIIKDNTMAQAVGIAINPTQLPIFNFAKTQEVLVWRPQRVT
jgi:uncharacterized protein YqjF (DUF2071 family)